MTQAALRRPFVTLLGLLLPAGFVSARAETFGRTTVGTIASGDLRPDNKRGSKFTLSENGTATELCAWLDGGPGPTGAPEQPVRFVLYRDTNGAPGAKLAETAEIRIWSGYRAGWICQEIGWTPLTAGAYWLMIHSGGPNNGPARYFYDGAANWFGGADTFADGASDPFGTGSTGNGTMSIYAIYTPASRLQNAGRMTVGNTPSSPLRGDFKRGSSITLPQAGRVTALTAYLDTVSSGIYFSYQRARLALYEDVNGVPGPLVAESLERLLAGGSPGRWITFPVPDAQVHAGKYWLMVHTSAVSTNDLSGSALGARYFADGTAGNWYGNADAFSDGTSNTFGTAGAGNGTLSAFASYEPGTFTTSRLGYTKVGVNPLGWTDLGGLGTSYILGNQFKLIPSGATLNGLYAYIDSLNLGTGTETQQVRMAVFDNYDFGFPRNPVAISNVLTIQAGRAPGWVKFDVPATPLQPGYYWIAVHTGQSSGITRTYTDSFSSGYENGEDDFADGPSGFVNSDGEISSGPGPVSAYATYTTN